MVLGDPFEGVESHRLRTTGVVVSDIMGKGTLALPLLPLVFLFLSGPPIDK